MILTLILGDQLFDFSFLDPKKNSVAFMAEDFSLASRFKYHKQKIALFFSAMRHHRVSLEKKGTRVIYHELNTKSFEEKLFDAVKKEKTKKLVHFEIADQFMEERIASFCKEQKMERDILPSPGFLQSKKDFGNYLETFKKPFMKTFYENWRKKSGVLMKNNLPLGGRYSFDTENRKKLPEGVVPSGPHFFKPDLIDQKTCLFVNENFSAHPGLLESIWVPTSRKNALIWLDEFIKNRLCHFGDYEDFMSSKHAFVFHSVLSPLLNLGLLTPQEVIRACLGAEKKIPLNSLEGFVRQVAGWREFVKGVYDFYDSKQQKGNFWNHQRHLTQAWYDGKTGIPLLDEVIIKVGKTGYAHHIERLMVLASMMNLCEIRPTEVYRWFMEMFVDSADWVMGPNVYGMGLCSDGGIFATKPYICGSNYWLKMSDTKKGEWCEIVDGLDWRFIEKNETFFEKNPRLSMMPQILSKMDASKKKNIFSKAEKFILSVTQ